MRSSACPKISSSARGIPAALLIFRRDKQGDSVLFIDASRDYGEGTNQNVLRKEDHARILATYQQRAAIDRYACVATRSHIAGNDYNLNISRYVDMSEDEVHIDMAELNAEIKACQTQLRSLETQMQAYLSELGLDG